MSFIARHNPLAIIPAAILFGGLNAASGILQRQLEVPDASVQVLMGIIFVTILLFETLYGRIRLFQVNTSAAAATPPPSGAAQSCRGARNRMTDIGNWSIPLAVFGGAIRVGTPYLYVSLGECMTEKSGRVNLGLEGTLVMGAMTGYAISYKTGSPWLGVLAAGGVGALLGAIHAVICNLPRVNSVAVGIAMMCSAWAWPSISASRTSNRARLNCRRSGLGVWSSIPQVQSALQINSLFLIGVAWRRLWPGC